MMSKTENTADLTHPTRPFPWTCPRKEVRASIIPYQCERLHDGATILVAIAELTVPKCGQCGELVFDYDAEAQINRAFQIQTASLTKGQNGTSSPIAVQASANAVG